MKKGILALDLDNVVADYMGGFLPFLETKGFSFTLNEVKERMDVPEKLFREFAGVGLEELALMPGASSALMQLSWDFQFVVVTSRPPEDRRPTEAWLKQHFPKNFFMTLMFTEHKGAACEAAEAFALVDDQLRFLRLYQSYALARPWNATWEGPRGDWGTLAPRIRADWALKNSKGTG